MISDLSLIPQRIYLDSNIVQYLNDFSDLVFLEDDSLPLKNTKGSTIEVGTHLYNQITSLRTIFTPVTRIPYQFAVSASVRDELERKKDEKLNQYFHEILAYWENSLNEFAFQGWGKRKLSRAGGDYALKASLSKEDFKIISDALLLECDCILTCDKFRNRNSWIYSKYQFMILYPTDLVELIKPYRSLWY